ncbi:aldehyde dehydrogenase family protein [Ohessyouella blattaphilus]|uniref:Aldehyde dehydrogenase family protein n=1 Tax=Ohessyouella blattaphilus TaxID=2949333 RepID=A0ABT1ELJ5_9FIRM|nr:aldehyde dehydrogenase family protein [Ohessyouella blattaphilus]MCP1111349.1 aldehyde dehydrogenase family protein [Ohessyouella blattaphilus]MCR8564743.1 aldehyde dehydrogenase family protein [Ohessyouella blattaphilus]
MEQDVNKTIETIIEKAKVAQKEFETNFSQEKVDEVVRAIGKVVYDNAEELAKRAVEESGMGVYADKVAKNQGKSRIIWNSLKGKKSIGVIEENKETGILKVAKAKGVVAAIIPATNPVVTPMCNGMFALKGQNAIVLSPSRRVAKLTAYLVEVFRKVLKDHGAPEDLFQIIEPTREATSALLKSADVVVATGGSSMVKAAYSSGKPAYGVGPGNVQTIVDRDINYEEAVPKIIAGRIFDNGIICSGEQSIFIPRENYDEVIDIFKKNQVYYADSAEEVGKFAEAIFPDGGAMNREVIGQSVQTVAKVAGVSVPEDTKMILLKARSLDHSEPLCKEKMCPVMIAAPYDTFEEAVDYAQKNLEWEGIGHSAALHSDNMDHIKYAGEHLSISRLVVNQTSSTGAGGSLYNGFSPTTTLGCGSWGNNSISENLNYTHLINISQIGLFNKDAKIPTDEEIWG